MDAQLQSELNTLIRALQGVSDVAKKETGAILKQAAEPLRVAIANRTPMSDKAHKRYKNGKAVATYLPGNLRRSFSVLSFRRARFAKFVGPKLDKGGGGKMPDGYYAHMVEFGTDKTVHGRRIHQPAQHFVEKAVDAVGDIPLNIATKLMKRKIDSYAAQNNLK